MPFDIIIGRDEEDTKLLGKQGVVLIGKSYVRMGRSTSLSNPLYMDIARGHVIFVVGKRGSGKCLTGDTLIQLENGSQMPIQELKNNDSKIFGLNDKLKIDAMAKEDFFEREVDCIVKMRMRSGREIKLTPEHPLLTIEGWIPANQLALGDRIAVPRNIPSFGKEELSEHEAKLMAYLIAEGHTKGRVVLFSNTDEKLVSDFKEALNRFDENMELVEDNKGCYRVKSVKYKPEIIKYNLIRNSLGRFGNGTSIQHKKKSIREFSEKTGMHNLLSAQKVIPEVIFKAKKESLKVFLNRLFSCDGSIYRLKTESSWEISYASSSEKLIKQVQSLLLRFGILSKKRDKKTKCNGKLFNTFELAIDGANVVKFIEEIGFFGDKEAKQEQALKESVKIIRNPNVDTIPKDIWDIYRPKNWAEVGTQMGYSSGKALRSSIAYAPSRQKLLQIAEYDNAEQMKLLATSDIFWDEIASLEILEGKFKVYDICVPEFHNFVANDIIVHNSYTLGAVAEGIMDLPDEVRKNLSMIIMDTMGIYWTMKYPNQKDEDLLELWGLQGRGMDVKIYTPKGFFQEYKDDGIPTDFPFSIKPSDMTSQDWILGFELKQNDAVAIVIEKIMGDMADEGIENYSIKDLIARVTSDESFSQDTKNEAINRFRAAERWGLFSENGMDMMELVKPGQITILDLSPYVATPGGWGVKALVLGLVGMRVFTQRMLARKAEELDAIKVGYSYFQASEELGNKEPLPLVWLVVDECLPKDSIVITSKNHTPIGNIYERFKNGETFKVLGYDTEKKEYGYYDVTNVWEKPAREMAGLLTETGRLLKCTPEHKVLSRRGFMDAISCEELAIPLQQPYSERHELIKSRLIGHIFGDGWSSSGTKSIGFSGKGCDKDLEQIKKDLFALGLKSSNIYTRATNSEITTEKGKKVQVHGTSQSIHASHKAFEYFSALGIPQGEKALCEYTIPGWLKNSSREEKAEFLAALMGSDGTIISPAKKVPSDFNPIRLSFNKIEEKEGNAIRFANDISSLFSDLGIEVSNICKRDGNLRKDGKKTIKAVITIAKNTGNMIRFLENIGYRYCARKEKEAQKWLCYLKARMRIVEEREALRQKALELQKQGFGKTRIAKKLGIKEYEAREWIYSKGKAGVPKRFPSFKEWVSERIRDRVIFEKIVSKTNIPAEPLYDISVDKVHNFVANGCIVHNCHEFLPKEGKTAATDALVTIMREGRQPGVCLILATQQPGKIHSDVMSQSDIIIAHRLTAKPDVDALASMSQSYLAKGLPHLLDDLPRVKGAALILDDNSERFYPMRVRPRLTWHGGAAPSAIKYKRKVEFGI